MFKRFKYRSDDRILEINSPQVWGIVNLSKDSFYKGSRKPVFEEAFAEAEKHIKEGADVIDIGAMSSRPGAVISTPEDDLNCLLPLLAKIKGKYPDSWVSIDTIHAEVAEKCIENGADIINDISGAHYDDRMISVAGKHKVPIVLMHMKGTPATMQYNTDYDDIQRDIMLYFKERIEACHAQNVYDIILDPGFGFSKTPTQNMQLLSFIPTFKIYDLPVLIGLSRKSTIYKTLKITPEEALNGTTALHVLALNNGAHILRVHDVKEALETVSLYTFYSESSTE